MLIPEDLLELFDNGWEDDYEYLSPVDPDSVFYVDEDEELEDYRAWIADEEWIRRGC